MLMISAALHERPVQNVYKWASFCRASENRRIAVGRDCRESSPEVFEYLVKGICDAGADVYDLG